MAMLIYRRKFKRKDLPRLIFKWTETAIKGAGVVFFVALPTILMVWMWYTFVYRNHIFIPKEDREILITGAIPGLYILYSLMTAVLFASVYNEYKDARKAMRRNDMRSFMELRLEEISPLLHVMAAVVAMVILSAFMFLEYSSAQWGGVVIGAQTFVFALLCYVLYELDDPCYGFWVLKSIPKEWIEADPKKWLVDHPLEGTIKLTETETTKRTLEVVVPEPAAEKKKDPVPA